MKLYKQAQKYGRRVVAVAAPAALMLGSSLARAAVDISADAATAKTDIGTAGGIIVGVVLAIAVITWVRKVIH